VEARGWNALEPACVDIPVSFGLEGGVWFRIREGIRGLLVHDERNQPHAYMICEPPTRYYRVMTHGDRMPSLIDEVI